MSQALDATGSVATYTVDGAIDAIGFGRFQWLLMCVIGLSWVADAMEMMLLSFLGPVLKCAWSLEGSKEVNREAL